MKPEQRKYAIYLLDSTLDWIARSDDWFKRAELGTRCISLIHELGFNKEAVFDMPAEYIVTDYKNLRKYREKLNEAIDEEDNDKRLKKVIEFKVWLRIIRLLKEDE